MKDEFSFINNRLATVKLVSFKVLSMRFVICDRDVRWAVMGKKYHLKMRKV